MSGLVVVGLHDWLRRREVEDVERWSRHNIFRKMR